MKKAIGALGVAAAAGCAITFSLAVTTARDAVPPAAKTFYRFSAETQNIDPVGESPPVDEKLLEHGHWVFRGLCIGCHGVKGDGNGGVWLLGEKYARNHKLPRQPRDFTAAVFKVRSTPSGSMPTDVDLFKAISRGLVADQDMPAFKYLPERDRWAVIAYIKSFSKRWQEEKDTQEAPVTVGEPTLPDEPQIVAGKQVYAKMQCAKCHGELGKGDGPSSGELKDDSGLKIIPRDFSDPAQFVAANDPRGIYQTFTTGLDGTPMPTFADFLNEEQRWQLVWYVMSLRPGFDIATMRQDMERTAAAKAMPVVPAASK